MDWPAAASDARAVLVGAYWDRRAGLFRAAPGLSGRLRARLPGAPWHPWWQAHALEALLDGVAAGEASARARADRLVEGVTARLGGDITRSDFVDDLAWLGLATWRAHELGLLGPQPALALAESARRGHDAVLGGFRWRFGDDYHNVPATAPAAILLARTAALAGDPDRLALAASTAEWLHAHVVDATGLVRDGCRPRGGRLVAEGPLWSYNVGTVAGLDLELAGREADPAAGARRRTRAAWVLRAGTRALQAGSSGIWRDERHDGRGPDPQLFRGILARAVADLVLADPPGTRDLATGLHRQPAAAWGARDASGRITTGWASGAGSGPPSLAAHLAGTLLLGSAARLAQPPG
jgi:predicted alpha-1,6-mannanase (GH76 family)